MNAKPKEIESEVVWVQMKPPSITSSNQCNENPGLILNKTKEAIPQRPQFCLKCVFLTLFIIPGCNIYTDLAYIG